MIKDRDFQVDGLRFHLNDGYNPRIEGKYRVVFWHEGYEQWRFVCNCNSKAEAVRTIRMFSVDHRYPFI